jgi:outer membrane receptor protein involved in Fe transport
MRHTLATSAFGPRVIAMLAGLGLGTSALAQQSPSTEESADTLSTVTVTGSRIVRPEIEGTVPVMSIGAEDFDRKGFENFADLAQSLPQFAPAFGSSRTQSTFSASSSSGLNLANLRNLGSVRTVVLVNGRRVPGGSAASTSVDFNTIPTANIERIEVSTGGASATYGADAVSGVINIITKRSFEGLELGFSYGAAEEGDNKNPAGHLMFGGQFGDGGRGLLTAQIVKEGEVRCVDRFLCAEDFAWTNPVNQLRGPAAYSGVGANGRFFIGSTSYTRRGSSFTDANGNPFVFDVPTDGYNRAPNRTLAIPTSRIMFAAEGEYPVMAERATVFAEVNYGSAKTDGPLEAHPFQSNNGGSLFGGGPGVPGLQATIPADNPFIPAALRALLGTQTEITWWQRFDGLSPRGAENNRETIRAVGGIRGNFESIAGFGQDWSWEAYHVWGRHDLDSRTLGTIGTDRLYYGLRVEADPARPGQFRCIDPGARALGCVPINPFAPYSAAQAAWLNVDTGQTGRSQLENTLAVLNGSVADLPAGPLRISFGAERRSTSGFLDYGDAINRALVTGNQISDVELAEVSSNEVFFETLVPVLKDKPFAKSLSLEGGYRRSNPNRGDDYDTWKFGGAWAPIEGLRFRAMRARSVRSPVPGDLSGVGQTAGVVNDPCTASRRNANATRAANCTRDGVPVDYAPPLVVEQSVLGFVGGNLDLDPEEATSTTIGVVWTPSFVPGLSLTLDRFEVDLAKGINTVGRQTKADLCYDTTDRQFCSDLTRGTNPALPGATWVLEAVDDQLLNVAAIAISGFDLEAKYRFTQPWGDVNAQLLMTFYDKADQTPRPGGTVVDLLGSAGGSTSDQGYLRRQGTLNLGYRYQRFNADWSSRYLGSAKMSPFVASGFPEIGSRIYHDARFAYRLGAEEKSEIYVGVTNIFDKDPPFFATGNSGTQALDTVPGYYDIFGRQYYAGMKLRL